MSHFFAYLARMKLIQRWGLMRNTEQENVQEHCLQVAIIGHALAIIKNRLFGGDLNPDKVVTLAVFHEVGEVITGDLATPIKYFNPQIKKAYAEIDEVAKERLFSMIPEELRQDYREIIFTQDADAEYKMIVKAADKLAAYLKCVEELKSGNQEFSQAAKTIREDIYKIALPEVNYFMEKFVPSFSLTLDEMN